MHLKQREIEDYFYQFHFCCINWNYFAGVSNYFQMYSRAQKILYLFFPVMHLCVFFPLSLIDSADSLCYGSL